MCTSNHSAAWKNFNGFQLAQALSDLFLDSSDIRVFGGLYVRPLALLRVLFCGVA